MTLTWVGLAALCTALAAVTLNALSLRRQLRAQDPRELAGQMAHAALQPVPAMRRDHSGHQLDEPRPIES